MNIIFHRYNSICEPDYIKAFKALGIEVVEDNAEMVDKNIPLDKRVEQMAELILINKPIFVFSINFFPYISMICEKMQIRYVCVSVDCPVPELYSTQIRNNCNRIFLFDYIQYLDIKNENPDCIFHLPLSVDTERIDDTLGVMNWEDAYTNQTAKGKEFYTYDVSFIGSLYTEKNKYPAMYDRLGDRHKGMCDGLLAAQTLMNGQQLIEQAISDELIEAIKVAEGDKFYSSELSVFNIDKFIAVNDYLSTELTVRDRREILTRITKEIEGDGVVSVFTRSDVSPLIESVTTNKMVTYGGVRSLDEMPYVFRHSKINLNPTMRSIQAGLSQRVWDVCGSGGFLLTNYQEEIPEYFEIGKHLEAYENIEEACEKVNYYLTHEDERIEIAKAGYELVRQEHTVIKRVAEMIRNMW